MLCAMPISHAYAKLCDDGTRLGAWSNSPNLSNSCCVAGYVKTCINAATADFSKEKTTPLETACDRLKENQRASAIASNATTAIRQ